MHSAKKSVALLSAGLVITSLVLVPFGGKQASADVFYPACSDGADNDHDGFVDYPADPDCTSVNDNNESAHYNLGVTANVTDGRSQVAPGRPVTYTVTLRPNFTDSFRQVSVDLYLPTGVVFVNASDGGVITVGRVHWDTVSVNTREGVKVLTVNANVSEFMKDGDNLVTRLVVDGQETTDTSVVSYSSIEPGDQFRLNMTATKQYALPGDTIDYTLKLSNISNLLSATNLQVTLPPLADFLEASDYPTYDMQTLMWKNIQLAPGQERTYTFSLKLDRSSHDGYVFKVRAQAGNVFATQFVTTRINLPAKAISTSVINTQPLTQRGQLVTYKVLVKNSTSFVGTNMTANAAIPLYGQFVSADNGGYFDGSNVRWKGLIVEPNSTRVLSYTIRVRNDAPMGEALTGSATANNRTNIARDTTRVVPAGTQQVAYNYDGFALGDISDGIVMPRTGADAGALGVILTTGLAAAGTLLQRRKFFI